MPLAIVRTLAQSILVGAALSALSWIGAPNPLEILSWL